MDHSATFELNAPLEVSRWRVIGNVILAIPHILISRVLGAVSSVVSLITWFAILFTGKLPEGLANVQCMIYRYITRVSIYTEFLTTDYPPFDFEPSAQDNGKYPNVTVNFSVELQNRNRLSTFFRFILLIPVIVVLIVWGIVAILVSILGFFAVLFTGRWPEGLRNFLIKYNKLSIRSGAYSGLLTDKFPSLSLE